MRKGIYTYRDDIRLEQQYQLFKQAGFDSVMIWWGENRDEALKSATKFNLEICNAHIPFDQVQKIWIPDSNEGDEYTQWVCKQMITLGNHKIPIAVMHLTKGPDTHPYNVVGLDRIKRIVDSAEKAGVKLALENLRLNCYLDYIFNNIQSDSIGFCYDSGHQHYYAPERDVLNEFKDKLLALHIADNNGECDAHSLPYDGTVDWGSFANILAKIRYNGVLSLEVQQDRNPLYESLSPQEFLELAFERACRFESEIMKSSDSSR